MEMQLFASQFLIFYFMLFFFKWVWHRCFCCSPNYVIKPCSVSRDFPCPRWILWFAGRVPCSRAKGLILLLVWTQHAPHPRLLPSPCGCVYLGTGDSAAWEEPAFVRMSGVPWFRSYCHLLLFRKEEGGRVDLEWFTQSLPSSLFTFFFLPVSVLFDFLNGNGVGLQMVRTILEVTVFKTTLANWKA